ncbi:glycosyltransferase family 2 protein, partial [Pedobacter sp. UBA5917]|uniref:glycosyltransferase family 2 protein n=1 Tax=Pedobacter sp. UBA5917 TaxID=1947061 RepID=UPI0025E03333
MIINQSFLISVCIPCYNAQNFLAATLTAFIDQSYGNIEIIVVDDCSSDKSIEILNSFSALDNRIKVLSSSQNIGAAAARNLAFQNSSGSYIVFFDADDLINEMYLEKQISLAKLHP